MNGKGKYSWLIKNFRKIITENMSVKRTSFFLTINEHNWYEHRSSWKVNPPHKKLTNRCFVSLFVCYMIVKSVKIKPGGLDLSRHHLDRDFQFRQFQKDILRVKKFWNVFKTSSWSQEILNSFKNKISIVKKFWTVSKITFWQQ